MAPWMTLQTLALVLDGVAAVAVIAWLWWARRRLAADTATAREQAAQVARHAEREAELAARERAHGLIVEAEHAADEVRDAAREIEQRAADQMRDTTERAAHIALRDQEVSRREEALQQIGEYDTLHWPARKLKAPT